jgi:hypothetical protein
LLLDPVSFGGTGGVERTLALLADIGVARYVVTRDLLDRAEASPTQPARWAGRFPPRRGTAAIRRPHDVRTAAWKVLS